MFKDLLTKLIHLEIVQLDIWDIIFQDYDKFLMDMYSYSTSIISELQQRFPIRSLFASMKILNPQERGPNSEVKKKKYVNI